MNLFRSWFDKRAKYVAVAKRYLEKQRLSILEEGFQSKRGRFDLVALDRKTLVMVSVRLRGCPEAVPDDDEVAEPRDVQVAVDEWLLCHPQVSIDSYRFDVLRLDWYANRKAEPVLRYFPDAISVGQTRRLVETSSP
jgi:Holliday junction resolvase-like predicted endonuclease